MESLSIRSPSKINLFLRVMGRRPDGYHEIFSLMQMVGLCDDLRLEAKGGGVEVFCDDPGVPRGQQNLAHRAAELLKERTGAGQGARIFIRKLIPSAAGLGGGSGNAAAVLLGLNSLWGTGLPREELMALGCALGSDVPFFLSGPRALARGRGELLECLPPEEPMPVVLLRPPVEVSSAWAYGALKMRLTSEAHDNSMSESMLDMENSLFINDLEAVVSAEYPVIADLRERLMELGALGACMTGSGPTVFGLFGDDLSAGEAYRKVKEEGNWASYLSTTLSSLEDIYGACLNHLGGN